MTGKSFVYLFHFAESFKRTDLQYGELKSLLQLSLSATVAIQDVSLATIQHKSDLSPDVVYWCRFDTSCIVRTVQPVELLRKMMKRSAYISACGLLVSADPGFNVGAAELATTINSWVARSAYNHVRVLVLNNQANARDSTGFLSETLDSQSSKTRRQRLAMWNEVIKNWGGRDQFSANNNNTNVQAQIWVLGDDINKNTNERHAVSGSGAGEDDYFCLIFQPLFKERNALYELDDEAEAKPYWKGIDTTPQRMMGAMMNLARTKEDAVVAEPFSHTGSLILEAVRVGVKQIFYNDRFEPLGTKDNISLLTAHPDRLLDAIDQLDFIATSKDGVAAKTWDELVSIASRSVLWEPARPFPKLVGVENLMSNYPILNDFKNRLIFYLTRRFIIESGLAIRGHQATAIVRGELRELLVASVTGALSRLRVFGATRRAVGSEREWEGIVEIGYDPIAQARCSPMSEESGLDLAQSRMPFDDNTVDCVITDPPYGYGSYNDEEGIDVLYQRFLSDAIRILKPGGYITLATINSVNIPMGNPINPRIQTKEVIRTLSKIARKSGMKLVNHQLDFIIPDDEASQYPASPGGLYFWRASRKLNRGIVSFEIQKD